MITKKRIQMSVVILLMLLVNLSYASAITGKIGNARAILYPEVDGRTIIDRTLLVINDNDVPVNITIEPSEEFKNIIEVTDSNFVLQPNEEKKAKFRIILTQEGDYGGKINVFFNEIGSKNGVALSSNLIIHARGEGDYEENPVKEETDSQNGDSIATGSAVKDSGVGSIVILSSITSFVLLAVLVFLIYSLNSKKKKETEIKDIKKNKKEKKYEE